MDERADRLAGLLQEQFDEFDEAMMAAADFAGDYNQTLYVLAQDGGYFTVSDTSEGMDRENITVVRP